MKSIKTLVAIAIVTPIVAIAGFALPASAADTDIPTDTVATIDKWDTVLTPNRDGSVKVSSTISPIAEGEKIVIALPSSASFLETTDYTSTDGQYTYSDATIESGYENYTLTKVAEDESSSSTSIMGDEETPSEWTNFVITSKDSTLTEPFVFSYTVKGAIFNSVEALSSEGYQQISLPLLDSSFGTEIKSYSIAFNKLDSDEVPFPDTSCIRNASNGDESDLSCEYMAEGAWNGSRNAVEKERVSLRAKFPANTFAVGANPTKAYLIPKNYLANFNSWDYTVNPKGPSVGTIAVTNRISYDPSLPNADTIAIAYNTGNSIAGKEDKYFYEYANPVLSKESSEYYTLEFAADNKDNYTDGLALFVIKPKEGVDVASLGNITYSYTVKGAIAQLSSPVSEKPIGDATPNPEGYTESIGFRPKSDILDTTVNSIEVTMAEKEYFPEAIVSSCDINSGANADITCETRKDGSVFSALGSIASSFDIDYLYSEGTFNAAAFVSPVEAAPVDHSKFFAGVGRFLLNLLTAAVILLIVFAMWKVMNARLALKKLRTKKSLRYEAIEGKPLSFIPSKSNSGLNLKKKLEHNIGEVESVSYSPPLSEGGKRIPSYLYFFMDGALPQTDSEKNRVVMSLISSLVRKGIFEIGTNRQDTYIVKKNLVPTSGFTLTDVEEEFLMTFDVVSNGNGYDLRFENVRELYRPRLSDSIVEELKELELHKIGKNNALATTLYSGAGGALLLGALGDAALVFGAGTSWILLGAGAVSAAGGAFLLRKGMDRWGNKFPILTAVGTGYYTRMEAFKNFFGVSRSTSRYSIEKADDKADYLPWAIAFGETRKWMEVFAKPGVNANSVVLNGKELNANILGKTFENLFRKDKETENEVDEQLYLVKQ